MIHKTTQKTKH